MPQMLAGWVRNHGAVLMKLNEIPKTLDTKFSEKYHTEDGHFSLRNSRHLTRSRHQKKIN